MTKQVNADVQVAVTAARDQVVEGEHIDYTVDVENRGPDRAPFTALALVFDLPARARLTAPPGWICQNQTNATQTTFTCNIPLLAADLRRVLQCNWMPARTWPGAP